MEAKTPILEVRNLVKHFEIKGKGELHAVDGVSFEVFPGETLGLVGESGCGKSTVGNVLMRLHAATGGEINLEGTNILKVKRAASNEVRKKMQIIFQDPYSSLNPRKSILQILSEPYIIHKLCKKSELKQRVTELIKSVGLEEYVLEKFPHELDGGRRQLVGIARALSLNPEFIVCDEPVSSLDVSIQATIINLLMDIQKKQGISLLFISHDLSVVRHISHRVAVMYLGQIVEIADTDELFANTLHPYSIALLSAVPKVKKDEEETVERIVLEGDVPSPINPKPGCRFAPRCWMASERCFTDSPELQDAGNGHCVACHYYQQSREKSEKILAELRAKDEQKRGEENVSD